MISASLLSVVCFALAKLRIFPQTSKKLSHVLAFSGKKRMVFSQKTVVSHGERLACSIADDCLFCIISPHSYLFLIEMCIFATKMVS
jgi:hypothetical protein